MRADHKMRDGSVVADRRLGRLTHFDPRSREYRVAAAAAKRKPRSYTWRCGEWLDQGEESSCVGAGCGHELIARPAEVAGVTMRYCREMIYWAAQRIDPWPGGEYPGAEPQYGGTSVLAGVKILKRLGWCGGYRWAFAIDDLLLGVSYEGPAIVGTNWYEGMCEPDADGLVRPSGQLLGGHCWLVRGLDLRRGLVRGRNSWGRGWGVKGDFLIAVDDLAALLEEDGECVFPTGRKIVNLSEA